MPSGRQAAMQQPACPRIRSLGLGFGALVNLCLTPANGVDQTGQRDSTEHFTSRKPHSDILVTRTSELDTTHSRTQGCRLISASHIPSTGCSRDDRLPDPHRLQPSLHLVPASPPGTSARLRQSRGSFYSAPAAALGIAVDRPAPRPVSLGSTSGCLPTRLGTYQWGPGRFM